MTIKIGFDISQTGNAKAGCGYFAANLIEQLSAIDSKNQYILYPTFGNHFWDPNYRTTFKSNKPNFKQGFKHSNLNAAKKFWNNSPNEIRNALGNIDILHANNFFCPPKLKNTKLIYTLYDLSFMEYPECSTEQNRLACFDGVFNASMNADLIIAISQYTRQHFLRVFPHFPAERIAVVYPASRFENKPLNKNIKFPQFQPEQFWLNVGTIEPRKNIRRLLQAYAKLRAEQPDTYPLVLAGKKGWLENDIERFISELGLSKHVHILGYVSDDELHWLYQNCFCLVYPSLFEGFGLPVLEAMTCGAPVITSNVTSLPEVAGKAAVLINPLSEDGILQAMLIVSQDADFRKQLQAAALERAKLFSWEHSARMILDLYQKMTITNTLTEMALS